MVCDHCEGLCATGSVFCRCRPGSKLIAAPDSERHTFAWHRLERRIRRFFPGRTRRWNAPQPTPESDKKDFTGNRSTGSASRRMGCSSLFQFQYAIRANENQRTGVGMIRWPTQTNCLSWRRTSPISALNSLTRRACDALFRRQLLVTFSTSPMSLRKRSIIETTLTTTLREGGS